jgi:hypothetical protein
MIFLRSSPFGGATFGRTGFSGFVVPPAAAQHQDTGKSQLWPSHASIASQDCHFSATMT